METFFAEHGGFAAALVSVLVAGWVVLGTALVRVKFGHIADHQRYQDVRLGDLEDDVSTLKGDKQTLSADLRNLSKSLEQYFEEMKERADRYEKTNDSAHAEIRKDQGEIKALIRSTQHTGA